MSSSPASPRSQVRRLPDRGRYDAATIHAILDAGFLCHAGFAIDGQPFVIPTLYARSGDVVYIHGSAASRMLRELQHGVRVCITVTHVDGYVLARSAFHHSINYRSAVVFGAARLVEGDEKTTALESITNHIVPGRWNEARVPTPQELKGTTVLAITIEEASAKIRTGPPKDDEEDYALPIWAGVVPLQTIPGPPQPDDRTPPDQPISPSIAALLNRGTATTPRE